MSHYIDSCRYRPCIYPVYANDGSDYCRFRVSKPIVCVVPKDRSTGSCVVDGRTYSSETSVPRDHPCHYCICYGGKIDCFWKQCAHIPEGCEVMAFADTCNPSLYICGNRTVILGYGIEWHIRL